MFPSKTLVDAVVVLSTAMVIMLPKCGITRTLAGDCRCYLGRDEPVLVLVVLVLLLVLVIAAVRV
jgi:hypothetical protein